MIAQTRQTADPRPRRLSPRRIEADGHHPRNGGGSGTEGASIAQRARHLGGQPEDRALYACGCGLAFDALVSTSVDCPGCGAIQAW